MTVSAAILLGGEKELGQAIRRTIDFDSLIKKGMPFGVISHIKKELNLADDVVARIVGISPRTIARRRKKGQVQAGTRKRPILDRLSPVESDRIYRFARIVALAEDVFESKAEALEWMKSPQYGLGGAIPFEMLQTDAGTREVEELLIRIDYGVIS
jgi:putative toxin-antitoxin system antitoxin component (TIGR02293 family)